ncbi:uncharacterized protein LOC34621140 [Cyclospora cayetanensis]|uniref:Uncharacterized protein LOC34621140 n=1 Tax=Cyclospora cayetanensis TaxID=88456 RepID=A0A6P6RVP1_9EIME|nr:uncharacterized protein LOC34621140 [Cyclospora cayetanensis]
MAASVRCLAAFSSRRFMGFLSRPLLSRLPSQPLGVPRHFPPFVPVAGTQATASREFATAFNLEPLVGGSAPDFEADAYMPSGKIEKLSLQALLQAHDGVCLLFYPLDFTFVCPTELVAYNKEAASFKEKNWALVGISVDSAHAHAAWSRMPPSEGGVGALSFPLVSDLTKEISRSFRLLSRGAYSLRGCVLIDKLGTVRHMTVNDASMGRNVEETLRVIDMISHLSVNKTRVCPACWVKGSQDMAPSVQGVQDYVAGLKK